MKRIGFLLSLMFLAILPWSTLACEPVAADKYYTVGDEIRFYDGVIKIHGIQYMEIYGSKVIAVDVSVRNIGESEIKINDQTNVKIYDQDGYGLRMSPNPKASGDRLSTNLRPGRTIRAEMAFHVGEESEEYIFDYRYRDEDSFHENVISFYLGSPDMSDEDRRAFIDAHNERFGH